MEERREPYGDRRFGFGRRMKGERRAEPVEISDDRRSGCDRRADADRRLPRERRASVRRFTKDHPSPDQGTP